MTPQIIQILLDSGGLLGILILLFLVGRGIGQIQLKIDLMDKKFDSIDERFNKNDGNAN